jgi:DNA-binding winged helix-turn-helix (wHTH) protein/Tol biopolymer transport system component
VSANRVRLNDVLVDFVNQRVVMDGQFVDVDAQALKVLGVLIDSYPQTVSRDELLEQAWPGVVVSDNSVSQAIASLRKAFGDDSRDPRFIRTVARKGYQLVASVEVALDVPFEEPIVAKPAAAKNILFARSVLALGLVSVLIAALIFVNNFNDSDPGAELYIPSQILSSDPGTEAFLRISPDGQWLAYSESPSQERGYDLVLKDLVDGQRRVLLDSNADEYIGDWSPDQRWLAYVVQDGASCQINVLDFQVKLAPHQELMACSSTEYPPRVRWGKMNEIYVAANHELHKISVAVDPHSSELNIQTQQQMGGSAPELIEFSPSERYLWMSEINHRDMRYQLSRYDLKLAEKVVTDDSISGYWGMSALSDSEVLVGGVSLEKIHVREGKTAIYHSSQYIVDLAYHPEFGIVVSEAKPDINLGYYIFKSGEIISARDIVGSTQVDYLPALAHDKRRYAYISGRNNKNGLGIWLGDLEGGRERLLVDLEGILPISLSWSPSDRYLQLLSNQRELFVVDVESGEFNRILGSGVRAFYPHWHAIEDRLYFNRSEQDQWLLVQLDAPSWQEQTREIQLPQLHRYEESVVVFDEHNNSVNLVLGDSERKSLLRYSRVDELSFDGDRMLSFDRADDGWRIKISNIVNASSFTIESLLLDEQYGNVPKRAALLGNSLMVTKAGQHQVDMVLLSGQEE